MRSRRKNNTASKWIERSILTIVCLFLPALSSAQNSQIPAHEGDSLALVAFYNQSNGPNWTRQDNWLTGPVSTWQGILLSVDDGRVIEIVSSSQNLDAPLAIELTTLSKLKSLIINFGGLTGQLPPELGNLTELQSIVLRGNEISGPIPKEIGSLIHLENFDTQRNNLSGEIPDEIASLSKLETLNLETNNLTGPIPSELERLTKLQTLFLAGNNLSGPIPIELTRLSNLVHLSLGGRDFRGITGSIPVEIAQLEKLWTLYLVYSQLEGPIPPELASLPLLNSLNLSGNQLSGSIPAEFGDLFTLEKLNLAHNELTGPIPKELANLTRLRHVDLSYNQLSGDVPFDVASQFSGIRYNTGRPPDGCHAGNNNGLCIPDTNDYRAIGVDPICGLPLNSNCTVTTDSESELPDNGFDIKVFPNPVKDRIRIEVTQTEGFELALYDALGRQVRREFVDPGVRGRVVEVNVDRLPVGSYVLRLVLNSITVFSEIIVVSR